MTIETLSTTGATEHYLVCGDLHINSSLSYEFEANRLRETARVIYRDSIGCTIILAGDVFDKNVPSLADIQLFYQFIAAVHKTVLVIEGNHDQTVFDYLPEKGFIYCSQPTLVNSSLLLVGHRHLESLQEHLKTNSHPDLTLVSHARCTVAPLFYEETSIAALAENFKYVLLGDIHTAPDLPYKNVHYTTSPSNIHFTPLEPWTHGVLKFSVTDGPKFLALDLPSKSLVVCKTFQEAKSLLMLTGTTNYRKVRYTGTEEELQLLARIKPNRGIIRDLRLHQAQIEPGEDQESVHSLADFLSSKVSITEYAFNYFHETFKSPTAIVDIRRTYEQYKTKIGRQY
jgi:metallophosphoesterase superfamily enzyme